MSTKSLGSGNSSSAMVSMGKSEQSKVDEDDISLNNRKMVLNFGEKAEDDDTDSLKQ